jgi:hypothetical protein
MILKVRCVDAKESDIPLREGAIYNVMESFTEVPEWGGEPLSGYTLQEVRGRFRQSRFEVVS